MTVRHFRLGALIWFTGLTFACGGGSGGGADADGGGGRTPVTDAAEPTPDAQVSSPDSTAPTPDAQVSAPDSTAPTPDAQVSSPDSTAPTSDAQVSSPDSTAPTPDGQLPIADSGPAFPDAALPTPDAVVPTLDAVVPTPDAVVPTPDAVVPSPDAVAPSPDAVAPSPDAAPPPVDPFAGLSDEFDDPATLATRWRWRQAVEGGPPQTAVFDVNASHPGMLSIQPLTSGWFGVYSGPFLYQHVRGDILLEVEVFAGRVGLLDAAPTRPYNSAGIVVRDPVHGRNADNWLMVNIGHQAEFVGTETKTTVDSQSVLILDEAPHRGRLRLCRVGSTYVMGRFLTNDEAWTEIRRYERPDLPDEVQLGLVTNGWNSLVAEPNPNVAPDLFARFGYARFRRPAGLDDCLAGP
jgi:hypothetical protein